MSDLTDPEEEEDILVENSCTKLGLSESCTEDELNQKLINNFNQELIDLQKQLSGKEISAAEFRATKKRLTNEKLFAQKEAQDERRAKEVTSQLQQSSDQVTASDAKIAQQSRDQLDALYNDIYSPKESQTDTFTTIFGVVLLLILIGILIYFGFYNNNNNNKFQATAFQYKSGGCLNNNRNIKVILIILLIIYFLNK
jgi:Fe2+ transport system protein B